MQGNPTPEEIVLNSGRFRIDSRGVITRRNNGRPAGRKTPNGYLQVRPMIDGVRLHVGAHRVVWDDNRPDNLECCSPSENTKHAHRTGLRVQTGELNPASVLTDSDVDLIRQRYAAGGIRQVDLAEEFGVSFQTISKVVRGDRRQEQDGPTGDYTSWRSSSLRESTSARKAPQTTEA